MNILFIGAGKMATAIAKGMIDQGGFNHADIAAVDIAEDARNAFNKASGIICQDTTSKVIGNADAVILAVKPQYAAEAVANFADKCQGKLVISIMAGIKISTLSDWFKTRRIIRIMPNTPLMIGLGASAYACGENVTTEDETLLASILTPIGILKKVSEDLMDAVTAVSGSGPAYIFEMIQAMTEAGVKVGLNSEDALELTVQTVLGAAQMLKKQMGTPDELRDAVTSPGGTTAAGLAVFKEADFRGLVKKVITAARDRSIELGKK